MPNINFQILSQNIQTPTNFIKHTFNDHLEFHNNKQDLFFVLMLDEYNNDQLTLTDDARTINAYQLTSNTGTKILQIAKQAQIGILDDLQEIIKDTSPTTLNQDVNNFAIGLTKIAKVLNA